MKALCDFSVFIAIFWCFLTSSVGASAKKGPKVTDKVMYPIHLNKRSEFICVLQSLY